MFGTKELQEEVGKIKGAINTLKAKVDLIENIELDKKAKGITDSIEALEGETLKLYKQMINISKEKGDKQTIDLLLNRLRKFESLYMQKNKAMQAQIDKLEHNLQQVFNGFIAACNSIEE